MSVHDKIRADEYKNKLDYPARVVEPTLLRKRARELTPEEAVSIPEVTAAYEAAKAAYVVAQRAYNFETGRLEHQLRLDIEEEEGMTGNPKAELLWIKAWERGHASGYGDVYNVYIDLAELIR